MMTRVCIILLLGVVFCTYSLCRLDLQERSVRSFLADFVYSHGPTICESAVSDTGMGTDSPCPAVFVL